MIIFEIYTFIIIINFIIIIIINTYHCYTIKLINDGIIIAIYS